MITAISNLGELATILGSLPSDGPLPTRTVIVRSEAAAHVLRRELVEQGHPRALVGTRFVDLAGASVQVLTDADVEHREGEERLRPARVRAALRSTKLRYFEGVRGINGWDTAFARTIDDLEAAALNPSDVSRVDEPRAHDVAALWLRVRDEAGPSWTRSRMLLEAAALLDDDSTRWPERGLTVIVLDGHETHAEAALIGRVPRARLVFSIAKPLRQAHVERVRLLFGDSAAERLLTAVAVPFAKEGADERSILASFFFEPPAVLASPARPRSGGRDGSFELEEHAGVDDEIAAAIDWVAREVLERRTPLEDIAIVVPQIDPLAGLLVSRLAALPWAQGKVPVHVIGGLPLTAQPGGARLAALFRVLRSHLHIDSLIDFLPSVRLADDQRVGRGAAVEILSSLGTIGGSSASPGDALEWRDNLARQREKLRPVVEAEARDERGDSERRKRRLATLDRVGPALDELCGLAERVIEGMELALLWPQFRSFVASRLPLPGDAGIAALASLDAAVRQATVDGAASRIAGDEAVVWLEERLSSLRGRVGRFGEPSITIATVAHAASLRFRAARIVGLAEGVVPRNARENPVLSDTMRAEWPELRRAHERTLEEVQSLARVVAATRERVVFSYARMALEGSYREPSPVFVEAAAAVGRAGVGFPDGRALARDYFEPARRVMTAPVRDGHLLRLAAASKLPVSWREVPVFDPLHVQAMARASASALAALSLDETRVPGLTAERPTSASRLSTLLRCGHQFLLESILGLWAPAERASEGTIDTLAYGDLFHRTAEAFYRAHGVPFTTRQGTLDDWLTHAESIVDDVFAAFLEMYPLKGSAVRAAQRARLARDVRSLLEHDWEGEETLFVAVERAFGVPAPFAFSTEARTLFLRGFIDRLDEAGGTTRVWDLKSGRAHPRREGEFDVGRDLQLALYARVVKDHASAWGLPSRVHAAYVYPGGQGKRERAFAGDEVDTLMERLDGWLSTAAAMLGTKIFPRTTDPDDCAWCAFQMVCGADAARASASLLEGTQGAGALFRVLKAKP